MILNNMYVKLILLKNIEVKKKNELLEMYVVVFSNNNTIFPD